MKHDVGVDVPCPLRGCGWTGHPRVWTLDTGNHTYTPTPRTMVRKTVYQHLLSAHPGLDIRERSILASEAADRVLEVIA